jgi:hypothetical protein
MAATQAAASREITEQQTWANRPDQYNPWGSVEWDQNQVWDPTTEQYINRWQQNVNLTPEAQWALDNQLYQQGYRSQLGTGLLERAEGEFSDPMDWEGLPDWADVPHLYNPGALDLQGAIDTGGMTDVNQGIGVVDPRLQQYTPEEFQRQLGDAGDISREFADVGGPQRELAQTPEEIRNRAEQAIYDRSASRLDPQWEQRESEMEAQLRAQGMRPGDEAYDTAMANMERERQDAYQTAMTESIMGGGQEGQRQYEQMLGRGQFGNQAQQQAYQQAMLRGEFGNQAQQQAYQQMLGSGQFANEAAQAALQQQLGIGGQQFAEQGQLAQFQMAEQQARYQQQVAAREREFMEAAQLRGMSNEEAQQEWESERARYDQMFTRQMEQSQYQNQLRQAQLTEEMQKRGFTLNEINALLYGQQVATPQFQGFSQASKSETPQYLQAADLGYQAQMGQFGAEQAQDQGMWNTIGSGVGAGMMMFSDRRLKRDVRRVGTMPGGTPLYTWTYVWGEPGLGVMADEAPSDAVHVHESGYLMVDYRRVR